MKHRLLHAHEKKKQMYEQFMYGCKSKGEIHRLITIYLQQANLWSQEMTKPPAAVE